MKPLLHQIEKSKDCIVVNYEKIFLGSYNTQIEAAKAYDSYVISNKLEHTINGVSI